MDEFYWDEEKGAYIDSFVSGRRHVSRQTNISAMRCGICGRRGRRKRSLRT